MYFGMRSTRYFKNPRLFPSAEKTARFSLRSSRFFSEKPCPLILHTVFSTPSVIARENEWISKAMKNVFDVGALITWKHPYPYEEHGGGWVGSSTKMDQDATSMVSRIGSRAEG